MKQTSTLLGLARLFYLPLGRVGMILIFILALLFGEGRNGACIAQDIHFSQSMMTPLMLNPALTGVFEGNQRVFLNYKNQWQGMGMSGATYNTALFSFDTRLTKKKWKKGHLGAGLTAFKDVAGDLKLGTTQVNLSLSGTVFINKQQSLSGAMQGGFVQKSISTAAMQWENQYDSGTGAYNPALLSNDIATIPPTMYGDFSSGLSWKFNKPSSTISANDQFQLIVGIAALDINTPKQSFYSTGTTDELYSRFVIHAQSRIGIANSDLTITPNASFIKQGPSSELNVGTLFRLALKNESVYTGYGKGMAISLGAQYRLNDAIIPMMLFEYSNYAFGVSYDVNTSSLTRGTKGKGGIEISLRLITQNFRNSPTRLLD